MKQIGAEIGVNESRVSQLHARAIRRLRDALGSMVPAAEAAKVMRSAILEFQKPKMAKAALHGERPASETAQPGVVVDYASASRTLRSKSANRKGLDQRQSLPSRKRSASATSPVTKIASRASVVEAVAVAR